MPRLSLILTEDQHQKLNKYLPWGTKQTVISSLIDQLNNAVEQHGSKIVGFIINNEFDLITKEVKK